jgi:quercetin dioxygenase-like cupin family protein
MKKTDAKEPEFAEKMKRLRTRRGISFEELAEKTGYEADYLEKVENKEVTPTVASVIQLSKVLSIESGTFLSAGEKPSRRKNAGFKMRTQAYAYKTLTPHAEQKHMKGFQVTIEPEADHKGVEYHHTGEEFIYVLSGALDLQVGQRKHHLKRGESLHFDSSLIHRLRNPGKEPTELLVVVYTP